MKEEMRCDIQRGTHNMVFVLIINTGSKVDLYLRVSRTVNDSIAVSEQTMYCVECTGRPIQEGLSDSGLLTLNVDSSLTHPVALI